MNSKAIRKQLLAAVAMVLVAAVALGSSTYAWFVASGTVKAEGMKVQAQSEGGLAIRWAGEQSELWGTTASAKMDAEGADDVKLLPASTYNLKKWTYAKATSASEKDADTSTWKDITKDVMGTDGKTYQKNNAYVVMQPFEIRSTSAGNKANGLYVSNVTITRTAEKDIDAALRVGVHLYNEAETDDGVFYIYGPDTKATSSYTWSSGADSGTTTQTVTLASYGTATDTNSQIIAKGTAISESTKTPIKVEIYIWYEGEDAKLYSDNYFANDLKVSVSFSSYGFAS